MCERGQSSPYYINGTTSHRSPESSTNRIRDKEIKERVSIISQTIKATPRKKNASTAGHDYFSKHAAGDTDPETFPCTPRA